MRLHAFHAEQVAVQDHAFASVLIQRFCAHGANARAPAPIRGDQRGFEWRIRTEVIFERLGRDRASDEHAVDARIEAHSQARPR